MNIKLRLDLLEIKLAEENKSVLLFLEKLVQKVTKDTAFVKMLTTYNMNSLNSEKKRLKIKMKSIDLEILLPLKKENAKTMMLELRVLTMIFIKLKKELMNSQN